MASCTVILDPVYSARWNASSPSAGIADHSSFLLKLHAAMSAERAGFPAILQPSRLELA